MVDVIAEKNGKKGGVGFETGCRFFAENLKTAKKLDPKQFL